MRFKGSLIFALAIGVLTGAYATDAPQYEYKTIVLNTLNFSFSEREWEAVDHVAVLNKQAAKLSAELNADGKAGWRLIQTLPIRNWSDRVVGYTLVLERQLK
jgi:hypothetical protein